VRTSTYTNVKDSTLIKAWEAVSLDAVTSTDQNYWQRIEEKFFQFMSRLTSTPTRTYCSL
jgi:hypothetical protein